MLEQGDVKGRPVLLHVDICTTDAELVRDPVRIAEPVKSTPDRLKNAGSSRKFENQTSSSL